MSFCVDASEADRFKNEKTIYASEEEVRRKEKYGNKGRVTVNLRETGYENRDG